MDSSAFRPAWLLGFALWGGSSCADQASDAQPLAGGNPHQAPVYGLREWYAARHPGLEEAALAIESQLESTSEGTPVPQSPAPLSTEELTLVLQYHCGECHFPVEDRNAGYEGLSYMNDIDKLISSGKVIPGDGEASPLVLRMRREEMPPLSSSAPHVPSATLDRIVQYINALPMVPDTPAEPTTPPWVEAAEKRPDVPPVDARCFEYLGNYIRCEESGYGFHESLPGGDLEECLQACRERSDCVAVTDYTWLGSGGFGCYIDFGSCASPSGGAWQVEDGGRQYLKRCTQD